MEANIYLSQELQPKLIVGIGIAIVIGSIVYALVLYVQTLEHTKYESKLNDLLEKRVNGAARQLQEFMKQRSFKPGQQVDNETDPEFFHFLSDLEKNDRLLIIDTDGNIYAFSDNKNLSCCDSATTVGASCTIPNRLNSCRPGVKLGHIHDAQQLESILKIAKNGGGYISIPTAQKKRAKLYLSPVLNTPMIVGSYV